MEKDALIVRFKIFEKIKNKNAVFLSTITINYKNAIHLLYFVFFADNIIFVCTTRHKRWDQ